MNNSLSLGGDENIDFQINLKIAEALAELKKLNAEAGSFPEAISNVNASLQKMANETGLSLGAVESKFKSVGVQAESLQKTIAAMSVQAGVSYMDMLGMAGIDSNNPFLNAGQPFGDVGAAAGYRAAADARRESAAIAKQEEKSAADIAKEVNAQAVAAEKAAAAEAERLAIEKERLKVLNQEQMAVEREGAALSQQLKNYGQIRRTASETMEYLRSFAGTQKGEGILTSFIGNFKATSNTVKQIDSIKTAIGSLSKETGATFAQAGRLITEQFGQIPGMAGKVDQAVKQMGNTFKETSHKIDLVRTALGTLIAIGIFNFIQAITGAFAEVIRTMRELETATYNLIGAERVLSEQGVNISPKDLDETIKKLQELDPLLSRIQATELVSRISRNVAPAVGFTKEQIDELSQSVAVFAIRNKGLGYSFEEVEKTMTEAFTTGKVSQSINKLGIKINDQIVKDEALRMGLVESAEAFDNLTGKQEANIKAAAMLSLIYADAQKEIAHLPDYLKTADAAFGTFQARITDVFTAIGEKVGPLLAKIFSQLADVLEQFLDYINKNERSIEVFVTGLGYLAQGLVLVIELFFKTIEALGSLGSAFYGFIGQFPILKKAIDSLFGESSVDTPTSPYAGVAEQAQEDAAKLEEASVEIEEKVTEIFQEGRDKRADIDAEYRRKIEDANRDHAQKMADIARDVERKQEDALRDYNQKVEDINRDAAEKVADAWEDYRQKEIDEEQEYQRRLEELRQEFLFNLEDALRERDARQVLRLIRQYQMDKKNLEEKHKLDQEEAKKDLQRKLQDIERERVLKLEAARRELAEKQAEIQLWAEREREDAAIALQRKLEDARQWHQRELQEYQQYLQRKLQELAKAIVKEYQLTAAGAQAIYNLLNGYFGANGSIAGLLQQGLSANLSGILSNVSSSLSGGGGTVSPTWAQGGFYGAAEGGTFVATRPTKVLFGEKGPEMATFTPLNRTGSDVGKMFGGDLAPRVTNAVSMRLSLSPDLVAEIVNESLDNLALHIERLKRER